MSFLNFKKLSVIIFIVVCPLIFVNIRSAVEENFIFKVSEFFVIQARKLYHNFYVSIAHPIKTYAYIISVQKKNDHLLQENVRLKTQLLRMQEVEVENKQLQELLSFKESAQYDFLSARVIAQDPFPEYSLFTLDKGQKDGIKKNQPALTQKGLAGYVWRVQSQTSQVILLTNPNAVVPVIIQRSRVHGIVEGARKNRLHLKYLKNEDDFQKGDTLVTSGINKGFQPGYPVGVISDIKKNDYGLNPSIEIIPSVNFSKIENLFIVLEP